MSQTTLLSCIGVLYIVFLQYIDEWILHSKSSLNLVNEIWVMSSGKKINTYIYSLFLLNKKKNISLYYVIL